MEREKKIIQLKFREVNRDIFDAIKNRVKKVETRAATEKYRKVEAGDTLLLVCGRSKLNKKIKHKEIFRTIRAMLKKYNVKDIHPGCSTEKELRTVYYSFPGYREKIKNYGLVAFELMD